MGEFGKCPICYEVPEKEVYQCSSGHLICHQCLSRVSEGSCPQCRIPFGAKKIRSRICEQMLDDQLFDCRFKDNGCSQLTPRGEMTTHANSCAYNPNTVDLCAQLGIKTCNKFRLGSVTKKEIINHFKDTHRVLTEVGMGKIIPRYMFIWVNMKMKENGLGGSSFVLGSITPDSAETSPLFLIIGKISETAGYLSLLAVKAYESRFQPAQQFKATFTVNRLEGLQEDLSNYSSPPNQMEPFPIAGSMTVCSVKEAGRLINECPVNFRVSLLEHSQFRYTTPNFQITVQITNIQDSFSSFEKAN